MSSNIYIKSNTYKPGLFKKYKRLIPSLNKNEINGNGLLLAQFKYNIDITSNVYAPIKHKSKSLFYKEI